MDSARIAVLTLFDTEKPLTWSSAKQGLLNVCSGALLVMKERLFRHDPQAVLQPTPYEPESTVTYHKLLERLERLAGITVAADDRALLDRVRRLRNTTDHKFGAFDVDWAKGAVADVADFVDRFLHAHFQRSLLSTLPAGFEERVSEFVGVVARREAYERRVWTERTAAPFLGLSNAELIALVPRPRA